MVNFGNSTDSQNNSASSSVTPRHLLIMEKLRAHDKARLKNNEPQQALDNTKENQTLPKEHLKFQKQYNTSTSSSENRIELIKRSTLQEEAFKIQCAKFRSKTLNSLDRAPSCSSDLELYTTRRNNNLCLEDDNDVKNTPMAGVLHLKEPIVNRKNEVIYYENRGKMDPMDWTILNKTETLFANNDSNKENKSEESHDRIEDIIQNKPEPSSEFINFVKNCSSDKTIYEVQGNIKNIQNTIIDSPILKLQRMINNSRQNNLRLSQEVKQAFEPAQPTLLLIDQIDSQFNKLKSVQNVKSKLNIISRDEETSDSSIDPMDSPINKLKYIQNIKPKLTKLNKVIRDERTSEGSIDQQNSLINKMKSIQNIKSKLQKNLSDEKSSEVSNLKQWHGNESNDFKELCDFEPEDNMSMLVKTNESLKNIMRKKEIDEYDDDMFNFVRPTSKQESTSSSFHSCDEIHSFESIVSTDSHKLIKCSTEKSATSTDSDDTFLERSSEFEDTSVSRKSNVSKKFESFRRKLTSTSTGYLPKPNHNNVSGESSVTQNHVCDEIKTENGEFLMRESITRYFKNCDSAGTEIEENNIVELVNIKTTSNCIPMLKELSTRYFSKQNAEVDEDTEAPKIIKKEEDSNHQLKCSKQSNANMNDAKLKEEAEYKECLDLAIETTNIIKNIPEVKEKTYGEACIISINQQNHSCENNIDSIDSASIEQDSDYEIILHTHTNNMENSAIIHEIHLNSEKNSTVHEDKDSEQSLGVHEDKDSEKNLAVHKNKDSEQSLAVHKNKDCEKNLTVHKDENSEKNSVIHADEDSEKSIAVCKDEDSENNSAAKEDKDSETNFADFEGIESDEEFDIVNLEKFTPFTTLVNRLKSVQALQKAHATGIMNPHDSACIFELEETNNPENKSKSLITSRSNESSLEISDNNYSSINASVSSNLDTDNDTTTNSAIPPNLLKNEKNNNLTNAYINDDSLNCNLDNHHNTPKFSSMVTRNNETTEMSRRAKRMTNALKQYQKNHKSKDTGEGNELVQQLDNETKDDSVRTSDYVKRRQILNEIKKQKLHLMCKPMTLNSK